MLFRQEKSGFKKVQKNRTFPKGLVRDFWQKMAIFFFIGGIWANPARKDRLLKFSKEKNGF